VEAPAIAIGPGLSGVGAPHSPVDEQAKRAHFAHSQRFPAGGGEALPSLHSFREAVDAGGLISYGPNLREMTSVATRWVAKILRGAKPAIYKHH
jgi:hypothetical protein